MSRRDSEGNEIAYLLGAEVVVPMHRVCEGFGQIAYLTLYANVVPCGHLCFHYHGRHTHMYLAMEAADDTLKLIRDVMDKPSAVVDTLWRDLYDPLTTEQREVLEVTS